MYSTKYLYWYLMKCLLKFLSESIGSRGLPSAAKFNEILLVVRGFFTVFSEILAHISNAKPTLLSFFHEPFDRITKGIVSKCAIKQISSSQRSSRNLKHCFQIFVTVKSSAAPVACRHCCISARIWTRWWRCGSKKILLWGINSAIKLYKNIENRR